MKRIPQGRYSKDSALKNRYHIVFYINMISVLQGRVKKANEFAGNKDWHRVEVTTPPLPEFKRTLNFYQNNGFQITGGRKLKSDVIC